MGISEDDVLRRNKFFGEMIADARDVSWWRFLWLLVWFGMLLVREFGGNTMYDECEEY